MSFRDELLLHVHTTIGEHGFFIQYVMGEGDEPPWGYTIGFLAHGHPEVVVFGLDPESTQGALHCLYDEIAVGRHRAVGPEHDQDLGGGGRICLLPVPLAQWSTAGDLLCTAVEYYRAIEWDGVPPAALQLVWAAPSGHFPWQPGCSTRFRRLQPIVASGGWRAA